MNPIKSESIEKVTYDQKAICDLFYRRIKEISGIAFNKLCLKKQDDGYCNYGC